MSRSANGAEGPTRRDWAGEPPESLNARTRFRPLASLPLPPAVHGSGLWLQRARSAVAARFGLARAAHGGMLVACVGLRDECVRFAERRERRSLVIGRHSECQVRTHPGQSDTPQRQVLLWNEGTSRAPRTRVMDLRGQLSVQVVGFGKVASALLEGPAALWLGHSHVFVGHVARGQRFTEALPPQLPSVDRLEAKLQRPVEESGLVRVADAEEATWVTPLRPPVQTPKEYLLPGERSMLDLRVRAPEFGSLRLALGRAALERGVLLGRYPRCDGGVGLPNEVSRVHLALMLHAGRPVAVDLGSTCGTWWGDEQVAHCALVAGRRLVLADSAEVEVLGRARGCSK